MSRAKETCAYHRSVYKCVFFKILILQSVFILAIVISHGLTYKILALALSAGEVSMQGFTKLFYMYLIFSRRLSFTSAHLTREMCLFLTKE